jgi:hypothetical protein
LYFGASLAPRIEQAASQIQDSRDLSLAVPLMARALLPLRDEAAAWTPARRPPGTPNRYGLCRAPRFPCAPVPSSPPRRRAPPSRALRAARGSSPGCRPLPGLRGSHSAGPDRASMDQVGPRFGESGCGGVSLGDFRQVRGARLPLPQQLTHQGNQLLLRKTLQRRRRWGHAMAFQ